LAQVKLQRQDWTGAQQIADTIRRLGNNSGVADQISGSALLGQNKINESIGVLQRAHAADPSAPGPVVNLVNAYLRAKEPDKAKAFLQSVLKADPKNADAYTLLGSVELESGQPDEALRYFNIAITTDPKNVNGYKALAKFYERKQDVDAAQSTIRAGLKQLPDGADLHLLLAETLQLKGDFEGAMAEYQSILDGSDPGSLTAANNLASLLTDRRTDQASLERAQSIAAILQKSPNPNFKDTLGWISYRKGDYTTAIPLLEQAVAALPNSAEVHYHLGMAYSATNQPAKAVEQFNAALNQAPDAELKTKIQAAIKKSAS
jgi:tetratricopeptide (TPR) repeat protein